MFRAKGQPPHGRAELGVYPRFIHRSVQEHFAAKWVEETINNTPNGESLEKTLWKTTDKLRKNMDAAEYKHIALGLIFLKYISDAFEEKYEQLRFDFADPKSEWFIKEERVRYETIEDPDEYRAENVFFVPEAAR